MENIKEKLTAAIEIVLSEGISREPGARRFLAERIVTLVADFTREATAEQALPAGDQNDVGEMKLFISAKDDKIRLDFGKPLAWFEMPKPLALSFCFSILEHCGVKIEHKIQQDPAPGPPA